MPICPQIRRKHIFWRFLPLERENNAYLSKPGYWLDLFMNLNKEAVMANKANSKPVEPEVVDEEESEGGLFGILDDLYDIAHDLFPNAVENFHQKVSDKLEGVVNYMEEIEPSWEAGCGRIYNKVMNFLDGAEESTIKSIDKVQHSPIGAAIDQIYKKNHRDS